jgi:hypothetical protein
MSLTNTTLRNVKAAKKVLVPPAHTPGRASDGIGWDVSSATHVDHVEYWRSASGDKSIIRRSPRADGLRRSRAFR